MARGKVKFDSKPFVRSAWLGGIMIYEEFSGYRGFLS
jgi:hypothetical protein